MTTTATEPTTLAPPHWSLDRDGSSVGFTVKTMWGLIPVRGRFDRFAGSYEIGRNGTTIELTIDADSVDTGNGKRDEHLRSSDFFDVDEPRAGALSLHARPRGRRRDPARRGEPRGGGHRRAARVRRHRAACRRGDCSRGDDDSRSAALRHEQRRARDDSPARDAARQGAAEARDGGIGRTRSRRPAGAYVGGPSRGGRGNAGRGRGLAGAPGTLRR